MSSEATSAEFILRVRVPIGSAARVLKLFEIEPDPAFARCEGCGGSAHTIAGIDWQGDEIWKCDECLGRPELNLSPIACQALLEAVYEGACTFDTDIEEQTDCPHGCTIEADSYCRH